MVLTGTGADHYAFLYFLQYFKFLIYFGVMFFVPVKMYGQAVKPIFSALHPDRNVAAVARRL